jgi:hypothetical protein
MAQLQFMQSFKYFYQNRFWDASYEHYLVEGYNRYRIYLTDGMTFTIARFGLDPKLWVQVHSEEDRNIISQDLVQGVGEGLETS